MDTLTSEQRRKNMQAIRSSGTKSEVLLAKALWNKGYRYRKNVKTLPGKPDIVFNRQKIAIFCDGDFWHGRNWDQKKVRIKQNTGYWVQKIENNMRRDKAVNQALKDTGWTIVRFWDKEIHKKLERCVEIIEDIFLHKEINIV